MLFLFSTESPLDNPTLNLFGTFHGFAQIRANEEKRIFSNLYKEEANNRHDIEEEYIQKGADLGRAYWDNMIEIYLKAMTYNAPWENEKTKLWEQTNSFENSKKFLDCVKNYKKLWLQNQGFAALFYIYNNGVYVSSSDIEPNHLLFHELFGSIPAQSTLNCGKLSKGFTTFDSIRDLEYAGNLKFTLKRGVLARFPELIQYYDCSFVSETDTDKYGFQDDIGAVAHLVYQNPEVSETILRNTPMPLQKEVKELAEKWPALHLEAYQKIEENPENIEKILSGLPKQLAKDVKQAYLDSPAARIAGAQKAITQNPSQAAIILAAFNEPLQNDIIAGLPENLQQKCKELLA